MALVRIEGVEGRQFCVPDNAWSTYLAIARTRDGQTRYLCNPQPLIAMRFCFDTMGLVGGEAVVASVLLVDKTGECLAIPMWYWPPAYR